MSLETIAGQDFWFFQSDNNNTRTAMLDNN